MEERAVTKEAMVDTELAIKTMARSRSTTLSRTSKGGYASGYGGGIKGGLGGKKGGFGYLETAPEEAAAALDADAPVLEKRGYKVCHIFF